MSRIFRTGVTLAVLLACVLPTGSTVSAQDAGTASVMERLDDLELLQRRMQQQLDEIKQLLISGARQGPPPRPDGPISGTLSIAGAPALGAPTATVVLVEFADFQCPYCAQFHRMTYPEIHREFVQTGKAQYVFKNFPLEGPHPFAVKSAEAAACAGQQEKFWDMHDVLFQHQDALAPANLRAYADRIGLDLVRFDTCMNGEMTGRVRADQVEGRQLGVNSTPTLMIGVRVPDGTVRVRYKVAGMVPPDRLLQLVRDIEQ